MSKVAFSQDEAENMEGKTATEILEWALNRFHPRIALASSFGAEDMVLIDMLMKINPKARVFSLDTGRLHQETYDVMDSARRKYGLDLEVYYPNTENAQKMTREHGLNLFYESVELRRLCCDVRKVEPLNRALTVLDAWITGLRREQAGSRATIEKVEIDASHSGIMKINPLAEWTTDDVWKYIKENNIPYNKLHDKGYPSIGCAPCTRGVKPGEDPRAGRWWWEQAAVKECGLHHAPTTNPQKRRR
ncbi:MAG: phosphoadenylyl-sulfate reductase [Candidatus Bathyarchaeia archaeon]